MSDNLNIYNKIRTVPQTALKEISAGRLKGKSDINPMWRLKMLTETFGVCGFGWKYEIEKEWLENGGNNEIAAFVKIKLYVKMNGEWSEAIPGTGGSSFVANEKNGLYTSDECFKMALTDALSVACKALGMGADVYWDKDKTKYSPQQQSTQQSQPQQESKTWDDMDNAARIQKMILDMHGKDFYKAKLKEYTAFVGKDGNQVAGVESLNGLKDARINTTYANIKKVYENWKSKAS